ncbi:hypothetical protein Pelo_6469 [Pelomyxa schiedti]|nr:hypothetical protein Pelo_6469 [Pelomyxa schiedti]
MDTTNSAVEVRAVVNGQPSSSSSSSTPPSVGPFPKIAVVIGNEDPTNKLYSMEDSAAMKEALQLCGFTIIGEDDIVSSNAFYNLIDTAIASTGKDASVVLYFSGHGRQEGGHTYLQMRNRDEVRVGDVIIKFLGEVGKPKAAGRVLALIDACRFSPTRSEAVPKGICAPIITTTTVGEQATATPPAENIAHAADDASVAKFVADLRSQEFRPEWAILYGCQPGRSSFGGDSIRPNSVLTAHLLKYIKPGASLLGTVWPGVCNDMQASMQGMHQVPHLSTVLSDFVF